MDSGIVDSFGSPAALLQGHSPNPNAALSPGLRMGFCFLTWGQWLRHGNLDNPGQCYLPGWGGGEMALSSSLCTFGTLMGSTCWVGGLDV